MSHARQKIRDHIATILDAIPDINVFNSRVYPIVALPVISVFTLSEESSSENELLTAPRRYSRRLIVDIAITVSDSVDCDEVADDFASLCEIAMAADTTLGGKVTDSMLSTTTTEMNAGEKPIFVTNLIYEIWYRTTAGDPDNVI
jgi:hypothetical protein